ncbi:transposase [Delftia sp. UME58]|uniref:transposase n=1 Tax=Delftia sp. UME58 TaxID=1862322 RepID=UPI0016030732|nr:transposase [Delftia sp. UME58]MBB1650687.1 transposase [Delftia sp. UME58]
MDKSKPDSSATGDKRQHQSREFKVEAVRQLEQGQVTGTQLALMLGVKRSIIYRWKKELATHGPDISFPGKGRTRSDEQTEIQRLKRELEQVKEERDILKKAAAYFARELP